ncbi:MAG: hypothetical protein IPK93_11160 [Solirubrobacterales bacterium]|nr:hypothetical protein [Solirubrobacterales bacterium]
MNFRRVHPGEWIASLCGLLILAGLTFPWYGEQTGLDTVSLLDVILGVAAISGLILPVVLAVTRTTNVPIVFGTFLSTLALLAALVLLKLVWSPDGGLKSGFFLSLAGAILLSWAGWRSAAREN